MNDDINIVVFANLPPKSGITLVSAQTNIVFARAEFPQSSLVFALASTSLCERTFKGEVDRKLLGLGVLTMQRSWTGKNVDLALLGERIEVFLKDKGFKIKKDWSASEYTFSARPQRGVGILERVIVRILGDSNDFLIDFSTSGHSRSAVKLGFITTMFGGGSLILRGLKSQEALEKLEKDFWLYMEESVTRLINSAS